MALMVLMAVQSVSNNAALSVSQPPRSAGRQHTRTIHYYHTRPEGRGGAVMAAAELNRWMREIIITNKPISQTSLSRLVSLSLSLSREWDKTFGRGNVPSHPMAAVWSPAVD